MTTLITNDGDNNLKSRLQELIKISEEVKILVGYFHFSGIKEIHETLKKLYDESKLSKEHIKILVGLYNTDEYEDMKEKDRLVQDLIDSIEKEFKKQNNIEDIYEQVKFFIKLLEKRIIVIKKTLDPNHSKLYLFKTKDISAPKLFISGSSNLTTRGLVTQKEFNIEIKDYRFEEAEKHFDDLWKDSISLSEDDIRNLIDKIKNETSFKEKKSLYNKEANKYRNIAIEYSIKREHQEAIRYFQKSIELYEKNGDYYNVSKAKLDLGNIYTKIRELENAEKCLSEGLEGIKKKSDEYWEATGYWYFGWLCIYKKDKETARGYFARAYNLFKSIGAEKKAKDVLDDMEKLDKDLNRYSESSSLQTNKNNMEKLDKDLNRYSESSSLNKNEKANTCDHIVTYKKSIIEKLLDAFKNLLKNVFKN